MTPLSVSAPAVTRRSRAKSDRRSQLIAAAERLVAERGYLAVRLEDIGAAAGVSGPAIYRHFPNKEALLVELLVGISTRLLAGATDVVTKAHDPARALDGLIDFHLDFALGESDLIRIQDRDLCGAGETGTSHHGDVGVGDDEDGGGTVVRGGDGADRGI